MVRKWPDGPSPGLVAPRLRQSTEVRVSLAAMADGMGEMVWIAAGHGSEMLLKSGAIPDHGQTGGYSDGEMKDLCDRGGFGGTGAQFYKPEEGL